jgi:8-oxo-dGTP pyrophosphatase MutT (NUDIX family)
MVGQWRFPLERYSWEMPEGGAEPGEGIEETAHRELREESGYTAGRMQQILEYDISNSVTDERAVLFLATELTMPPHSTTPMLESRWKPPPMWPKMQPMLFFLTRI